MGGLLSQADGARSASAVPLDAHVPAAAPRVDAGERVARVREQGLVATAIRSATGIETLIWLIEVAGYTRERAADTVKATAQALLAGAAPSRTGSTGGEQASELP